MISKGIIALNALCLGIGYWLLQIVPSQTPASEAMGAYLISAIVAESSVIIFLALYARSLNKIIKTTVEKIYEQQIQDQKAVIKQNTEAFVQNTESNRSLITSHNQIAEATTELRLWLADKFSNERR